MLEVCALTCGYKKEMVVREVSFSVGRGTSLLLIGANGSGKTTLLRAIGGLLPYEGSILLGGREARTFSRAQMARHVALLPQVAPLYMPYSVLETALMGRFAHTRGLFSSFSREDAEIAESCLQKVGLYELRARAAGELSGGQLQRLYLARAFCQVPDILLLDEPTNHLDLKHQIALIDLLAEWREQGGVLCGAMHELNLALHLGGRALLLEDGRVCAQGEIASVLHSAEAERGMGLDVAAFMRTSLEKWEHGRPREK